MKDYPTTDQPLLRLHLMKLFPMSACSEPLASDHPSVKQLFHFCICVCTHSLPGETAVNTVK